MDNKVEGKVLSVESSFLDEKIELKLDYLSQLIDVTNTLNNTYGRELAQDVTVKRIIRVCNSIEEDLGIKKVTVVSDMVVNLSVNASNFERELKDLGKRAAESAERIASALKSAAERISES